MRGEPSKIRPGRLALAWLLCTACGCLGAAAWMRHGDSGIEGVVAKRADHGYYPSRHTWSRVRSVGSAECR